jgi:antitoxin YokJ
MVTVDELIERAFRSSRCVVHPPAGAPSVPAGLRVPDDLGAFYEQCGGAHLFLDGDYGMLLLPPAEVLESNVVIVGQQYPDDLSSSWFAVARSVDREYLSIDLSVERNGRIYDSFYEIHAVVGSSTVIANSFTELFTMLMDADGDRWPWLVEGFVSLGDAYD